VNPASGQNYSQGAVVQVSAAENSAYTFNNWTGAVADPYATYTTLSMTAPQSVTANFLSQAFTDVAPGVYYFDAVNLLSQLGITSGCAAGTYCPTQDVLRSQMAVFIVRMVLGLENFTYNSTPYFTDVPPSAFGFKYIQKLYELGVTTGCSPTTYCPNESVTRAQMAIFIIRARYGATTAFDYTPTPYFTDVPTTGFGFSWIQRMKEDNITSGCTATTYCPNNPVTRGDMAIFLMRGGFNRLLPLTEPVLISVTPTIIGYGDTQTFTVTGNGTHFVQGSTNVNPTSGFQAGSVTVLSPTNVPAYTDQPLSIWVTTDVVGNANEEAVIPNAVTVVPNAFNTKRR
jgi:hypothetical protein